MVRNQKVGTFSCALPHFLFLAEMRKAVLPELLPSVGLKPCTAGDSSGCEEQALTLIFIIFSPELVWFWCPPGAVPILLCPPRVGRGHRGDRACLPGWMGLTQRMEHPGNPAAIHPQPAHHRAPAGSGVLQSSPGQRSQAIPAQGTMTLFSHPVVPQFAWILNI